MNVGDVDLLSAYISSELLDMTGFYYTCKAIICDPRDSILLTPISEKYGCDEYYDKLIDSLGTRIGYTSFFYIKDFDGVVEYLGRFSFSTPRGGSCVYIRFESKNRHEGIGYAQILSREIGVEKEVRYHILMRSTRMGYWWIPKGTLVTHVIWSVSGRSNTPVL